MILSKNVGSPCSLKLMSLAESFALSEVGEINVEKSQQVLVIVFHSQCYFLPKCNQVYRIGANDGKEGKLDEEVMTGSRV